MTNLNVAEGDLVSVHYVASLDDGTVFDDSRSRGNPITFKAGSEELILEFSQAAIGMKVGEVKKIQIEAENAYGEVKEEFYRQVDLDQFTDQDIPPVGTRVSFQNTDQKQIFGVIHLVEEDKCIVDFNHPLAGKNLNFEIEVMDCASVNESIDLSLLTVKELKEYAKKSGFKGYSKMKKSDLINLLENKGDQVG